jgi:hypothetical protein
MMVPKLRILTRGASAIVMMAALLFLTTANAWAYGLQKEKKSAVSIPVEEEPGSQNAAPNPVEEKTSNGLQNLSDYLHEHHCSIAHPLSLPVFGNRHDIINYPIHHPELITPPPKKTYHLFYC